MRHTHAQPAPGFREPAARDHTATDQAGRLAAVVFFPIRLGHEQGDRRGQVKIDDMLAARVPENRALDETKSGVRDGELAGWFWDIGSLAPNTSAGAARLVLGGETGIQITQVGR